MGWLTRIRTFFAEVRAEMKKVTYPSRNEVVATSIVVVVTSAIFGGYLYVADYVIAQLYLGILKVFA
jgi:preprotein translocase subunit SecE